MAEGPGRPLRAPHGEGRLVVASGGLGVHPQRAPCVNPVVEGGMLGQVPDDQVAARPGNPRLVADGPGVDRRWQALGKATQRPEGLEDDAVARCLASSPPDDVGAVWPALADRVVKRLAVGNRRPERRPQVGGLAGSQFASLCADREQYRLAVALLDRHRQSHAVLRAGPSAVILARWRVVVTPHAAVICPRVTLVLSLCGTVLAATVLVLKRRGEPDQERQHSVA